MFCPSLKYVRANIRYIKKNVIIIDVLDSVIEDVSITRILSHEIVHFQQCINLGSHKYVYKYQTSRNEIEEEAYLKEYDYPVIAYLGEYKKPEPHYITEIEL